MALLYIWIDQQNNITKQGFNLSNKYNIEYNPDTKVLSIEKNNIFFKDFFRLSNQEYGCRNLEIIGVVGANGTGKSTLLDFIWGACSVMPFDLIVYEDNNQIKICINNLEKNNIKIKSNAELDWVIVGECLDNQEMIYYSNVFDYNSNLDYSFEVMYRHMHNISTNHLLNFSNHIFNDNWPITQRDTFRSDEIVKQIIFNYENKNVFKNWIPFEIPNEIQMELVFSSDLKGLRSSVKHYHKDLDFSRISNLEDDILEYKDMFYLNIVINLINELDEDQKICLGIIEKHMPKDKSDHFSEIVKEILEEILKIYSDSSKKINYIIDFIEEFENFIKQSNTISIKNGKMIFNLNEFSYKMILHYKKCFYKPEVLFDWYEMSSGEKNMLSIYGRFYELIRENHIVNDEILILIDEIDTYLHPEWQRKIVNNLIRMCNEFFRDKNVKVIITSHSPFIVSDLPDSNIIFLDKENNQIKVKNRAGVYTNTFGANIHTLYSKAFFMDNIIGEFANQKIKAVIKDLSEKSKEEILSIEGRKEEIEYIIKTIGEPVIKKKIENMYRTTFPESKKDYELQIEKLQREKIELEENLKDKGLHKIEYVMKLLNTKIRELEEKTGDSI